MSKSVKHPDYYNKGIETIDYIESWGMSFTEGNVIKYVTRYKYKQKPLEDLYKAREYLNMLIASREAEQGPGYRGFQCGSCGSDDITCDEETLTEADGSIVSTNCKCNKCGFEWTRY